MPLGATRLLGLGRYIAPVTPAARSPLTVTAVNNAQVDTAQSKFGGASAYFDGTGDQLDVTYTSALNIQTGDFTIELWFRSPLTNIDGTYGESLLGQTSSGANGGWIIRLFTTKLQWVWDNVGGYDVTFTFSANTWYHVAFVRTGTSMDCYINGTSYTVTSYTNNTNTSTNNLKIGKVYSGFSDDYTGHIDEVRISKVARYSSNFTAPTAAFTNDTDTVLLLHMNGTDASTVFKDDAGVRAQIGISAINDAQVDTAQSKFGGASALFDGTGDYLRSVTFPALGTGDFTIEYFLRFDNLPSANAYMTFDARPGSNGAYPLIFHRNDAAGLAGDVVYYVDSANRITTGVVLSVDTWHHLAVVRSSGTTKLYIDGTQQGSDYSDSTNYAASTRLTIGANMNDINSVDGHIDEIRVSDIARYTGAFTAPTAAFTNDANTLLLIHANGTDATKDFEDDNT